MRQISVTVRNRVNSGQLLPSGDSSTVDTWILNGHPLPVFGYSYKWDDYAFWDDTAIWKD